MPKAAPECLALQVNLRPARHNPGGGIMQVIDGALRMSRGGEDRTLVLTQNFQPVREVRSVIFARLGGNAEIGTQEGRPQLGHELLAGVGVIAKAFASELPVETALMFRPVGVMPTSA